MNPIQLITAIALCSALYGCGGSGSQGNAQAPSEPFQPVDPPAAPTDSAASCFNPDLLTAGTRYIMRFEAISEQQITRDSLVVGASSFAGEPAIEVATEITAQRPGAADFISQSEIFYQQPSALESLIIGTIVRFEGGGGTTDFDPGAAFSFALQPEETLQSDYATTTMLSATGEQLQDDFNIDITYIGRTTVTVPAGTFTACEFEGRGSQSGALEPSRLWIDEKSGLVVKQTNNWDINGGAQGPLATTGLSEFITLELDFGSINGVPIDQLP